MWEEDDDGDEFEPLRLTLSGQQLAAVDTALGAIETGLAELVEYARREPVDPTELGGRQEIFCRETLMRLVQNPHLTAGETMYDTANESLRALDQLRPRLKRLQRLGEEATRIESMLSEHVLFVAHMGYFALRAKDQARGLEALHAGLSWRRRGRNDRDFDVSPGFDEDLPED